MNLLVVSDAFWPDHTGGVSKSLLTEVEGLVARGHRVTVLTRRLRKGSPRYEQRAGYEVYRYPSPPKGSILYRMYPLFSLTMLRRSVKRLPPAFDVVYAHNVFQVLGWQDGWMDIPIVYTFHAPIVSELEIDARSGKYGLLGLLLPAVKPLVRKAEQAAFRRAGIILARSEFMKHEALRLGGLQIAGKIRVVPLAVDTTRYQFVDDPRKVRTSLGLPVDRRILLTVRRLVGRMGLENLVDAMKMVVRRHPDVVLLIGGTGYLKGALQERICSQGLEEHVRLLGFIPEETLPMYYQAADLFVLPTRELEGFGLATIEALSCGTPVVATPVGANPEVVGPLGREFLCRDETAQALAERITQWLDRGVPSEIRRACRAYCVSKFSVERVIANLEDAFSEAIKEKRGANDERFKQKCR